MRLPRIRQSVLGTHCKRKNTASKSFSRLTLVAQLVITGRLLFLSITCRDVLIVIAVPMCTALLGRRAVEDDPLRHSDPVSSLVSFWWINNSEI